MLEKNDRPGLALRLLKRYTSETFESPRQWRAWLTAHRGRLFFSDAGGYRFFITPEADGRPEVDARARDAIESVTH
jgi:hypothetical protein